MIEQYLAVGIARPEAAVVEVHGAIGADQAHALGWEAAERVVLDQVLFEQGADQMHRLAAPGDHLVGILLQQVAFLGGQRLVDAAGHRAGAMHPLAGGVADHLLAVLPEQHALLGRDRVGADHADDVALRHIRSETEQQVGRRQMEEVQGVGLQDLAIVHQAANLLGGRRQRDAEHHVQRLRRGQVVRYRADAAQALHHHRHFPVGTALDELLEAAELDDVQSDLMHLVVVVEQDGDLAVAFDPGHRVDGDAPQQVGVGGGFQCEAHDGYLDFCSVVVQQAMTHGGRAAGDQVGEELPDRVGRGRAAGQEVIDFHHFMDRVHLVQGQGQLGSLGIRLPLARPPSVS